MESKREPEFTYLVSDTWHKDLPVFVSDSKREAAAFLGISKMSVGKAILRRSLVRKRYSIERIPLNGEGNE